MIIDGRAIAEQHLRILARSVSRQVQAGRKRPKLAIILVGSDQASHQYMEIKSRRAIEIGISVDRHVFAGKTSNDVIITNLIEEINRDPEVSGVIVQLPLPKDMDTEKILAAISPEKDVDELTGKGKFFPATVKGILTIFQEIGITKENIRNKRVTIIGQGRLVGKPLADYLEKLGVRLSRLDINSGETEIRDRSREADILVVATGAPNLIKADMVKPGAVVIDCGSLKAEVDPAVGGVAGWITPVPGGVGPLTIVSLLENTAEAARIQQNTHTQRLNP